MSEHDDLNDDLAALTRAYGAAENVRHLTPRLYERGDVRPLLLDGEETDPSSEGCTTVVVLGSPTTSFVLRFAPTARGPEFADGENPEQSVAGAAQLVRCGIRKSMLGRLVLEMRSPRGVLETLVVRAKHPVAALTRTLAGRAPGPSAPFGQSGPRPTAPPLAERARATEAREKRQGAAAVDRRLLQADRNGTGEVLLTLPSGCHRFDVLGVSTPSHAPHGVDVDAELVWLANGEIGARDRTESADATLALCNGEAAPARLRFIGSPPGAPVVVLAARWPLPAALPEYWGPTVRARMAETLRDNHVRNLASAPVYSSLGVTGVTLLPLEVEPGRCYIAALAALRGTTAGLAVGLGSGTTRGQNRSTADQSDTSVSFCAGNERRITFEVEARGSGVAWLLSAWPAGRLPLGEVAE